MAKRLTVMDFFKRYPDEETCLDHVMETRYGKTSQCAKCLKDSEFYKIAKRPAYACKFCGHHVYPCAGTPFENTRTPLQMWFYAIYLFTTTKHGVPAKELQRQLGVTYKTAWRMGHEIRKYMAQVDGDGPVGGGGIVEVDETYIGGKSKGAGFFAGKKETVLGMVERNGNIITKHVPNNHKATILPLVAANVVTGAQVSTDQFRAYQPLASMGYNHSTVNHSRDEWVRGETHTQTIEGFWGRLKLSIRGTHVHVSKKHLQKYLGEFEYRFNHRHLTSQQMMDQLMRAF